MKTFKFGLNFIDVHLNTFPDRGIYLFSENSSIMNFSFIYHLLQNNLSMNNSCLFLSSLDTDKENEVVRKKINSLNKYETFTALEIPSYINQFILNSANLNHVLEDLGFYISSLNPKVIIVKNIDLLIGDETESSEASYTIQIMKFLYALDAIVIIDDYYLSGKTRLICEKYVIGTFEVTTKSKTENNELLIKKGKDLKEEMSIMFTTDDESNVIPPLYKSTVNMSYEECKHVYLMSEFKIYENVFSNIFTNKIEFHYYSSFQDIKDSKINNKFTLLLIPVYVDKVNGWQILTWVQKNNPFCRILFTDSKNLPANQKIRAIKMGASKFLNFPFTDEDLEQALIKIYKSEDNEQEKYVQHKILFVQDDFLKGYKSNNLFRNSLTRFIKEYSFTMISSGLSTQFCKLLINENSIIEFTNFAKKYNQLIFASSYFIDEKQAMLLIFKNVNEKDFSKIKNEIISFLSKIFTENVRDLTDMLKNKSLVNVYGYSKNEVNANSLKSLYYPLQETNIDFVIEWIYQND